MSRGIESACRHCGRVFGTKTWRDEHARRCPLNPSPPGLTWRQRMALDARPTPDPVEGTPT